MNSYECEACGDADPTIDELRETSPGVILTVWYPVIAALIARRFWDYWSSLLS